MIERQKREVEQREEKDIGDISEIDINKVQDKETDIISNEQH